MASTEEPWTEPAARTLRERLRMLDLPLHPERVRVHDVTDALGNDAWRVTLVLPAPRGVTWDRETVYTVRRAAVAIFDAMAAEAGQGLPGSTIAVIAVRASDDSN